MKNILRANLLLLFLAWKWDTAYSFTPAPPSPAIAVPTIGGGRQDRRYACLRGPKQQQLKSPLRYPTFATTSRTSNDEGEQDDLFFDGKTTAALVGGQSLLVVGSVALAALLGTPKFGFGHGIAFTREAISYGVLLTLPLGSLAAALDLIEDKFPALQDVTKATQRSVLALLGGKFKPLIAVVTSLALGCVAGFGEEMLFRGVLQYELSSRIGQWLAVGISSLIFGALHAVTPLYAFLASLASVYFGSIYLFYDNLAVPIACHFFYDLVALLYAHWTVTRMSPEEQDKLSLWKGPGDV